MPKIKLPRQLIIELAAKQRQKSRELTYQEAIELLEPHFEKRKKRIHTIELFTYATIGCNVDFAEIKSALRNSPLIYLSFNIGVQGGHNVGYIAPKNNHIYLKTNIDKIDAIFKQRKLN